MKKRINLKELKMITKKDQNFQNNHQVKVEMEAIEASININIKDHLLLDLK